MSDPLSLLPLALASREGMIDGAPASQYIAAGLTLLQRSAPLVRALSGRRAGILLPTSPSFITALAASEGRGAVLMNPLASTPELAYQIADAGIGAVFTSGELADRLPRDTTIALLDDAPRSARVVVEREAREVDLGSHFALALEGDSEAEGSLDEATVVYTSAMHGRPLGAILSHRSLLFNARSAIRAAALTSKDHTLAALPFSHLFGFLVAGVAPLLAGARVTTMSRFNPARALEIIEQGGITMFVGVPSMYIAMIDVLERRSAPRPIETLRLCICGGAPLRPAVQRRWRDLTGIELRQGYGLTETSSGCLCNIVDAPNVIGALGQAYPGVDVAIRDARTFAPAPDGEVGEICVRGPTVFQGYVVARDAAPPRGLEMRDEWLRTGDLGVRRPDGFIEFRGLLKPMFTRNGFNIYPRELELAIAELSGVTDVHVRPAPDQVKENGIVVDVCGGVTVDDVRLWCATRLSAYKQPTIINIAP